MTSLDFTEISLNRLITHHIGNKLRDEKYILSNEETRIESETLKLLLKYFLLPINVEEFYSFTHQLKLELNDIYSVAESIFSNPRKFVSSSKGIAKLLYEQSMHPKIKAGELNIAYFTNSMLNDESVDAIGIFKSESDVPFIKMMNEHSRFSIKHDYGFDLKGMDKGCVIFNTDAANGYKLLLIDNSSKSGDAQYWKDNFLQVTPISDDFHQTQEYLGIAKSYITKQLPEEFNVTKADKIDLLNRTVEYFKRNGNFDKEDFERGVFFNPEMRKSFQNFDTNFREENEIELTNNFEISKQAVKKQARVFKNVLKLDKNFHVYIHGNTNLIEHGVEKDGRKYYKIYYDKEN